MLTTTHVSSCTGVARVRTLVVDDHPIVRWAIRESFAREPELEVIAEASSVAEAIACLQCHPCDVVIVDLVLPDARGVEVVNFVTKAQPDCKVLACSAVDEPTQMAEILRAGASGYVMKTQPVSEIVDAVRCVLSGRRCVPPESRSQVNQLLNNPKAWPLERLTAREREVFELLVAGHLNEDIGALLFISKRTVETHRHRVMNKLRARSLIDLIQIGVRHGIIPFSRKPDR